MSKYTVDLNYGYQRSHDTYETYHSFELEDPDGEHDEKMGERLAELLDTTVDDDDFDWKVMRVRLPDTLVARIQRDFINQRMREAGDLAKAYELFKLWWMIEHGFSLTDLIQELHDLQSADPEDSDRISTPVTDLFEEWEDDHGFGNGSLWPCFDEFIDCEYKEIEGKSDK